MLYPVGIQTRCHGMVRMDGQGVDGSAGRWLQIFECRPLSKTIFGEKFDANDFVGN